MMCICCFTCSVILNVTTTQYTWSLNGVYHPHWLAQWNHHCSLMHIAVHSPWLPGYINVAQTVLVILIMTGFFPDRPCIFESDWLLYINLVRFNFAIITYWFQVLLSILYDFLHRQSCHLPPKTVLSLSS